MNEKILEIREVEEYDYEDNQNELLSGIYDGYIIKTDRQEIFLFIESYNFGGCCETFGYITSEDNIQDLVGTTLHGISTTDTAYKTKKGLEEIIKGHAGHSGVENTIFINLDTRKGDLQFVAYNIHNGCYGHDVLIRSRKFVLKEQI